MKMREIPWNIAKEILEKCSIPTSQGWDKTIEKNKYCDDKVNNDQVNLLFKYYKELLICGDKSVRFYDLEINQRDYLIKFFQNFQGKNNVFTHSYPFPVSEKKLEDLPLSSPELVGVEFLEEGIAAIYSSVRTTEQRISLKDENLLQENQTLLEKFSEVIGVRNLNIQTFDVIWIPYQDTEIELRIDCPLGTTRDSYLTAHQALISTIILEMGMGEEIEDNPLNLFPLIDRIYRAQHEGRVVELAFTTKTASIKHEKMRRRRKCLREEIYHQGGTKAIQGEIDPFRIGVQWEVSTQKSRSFPELVLNGTSRMLHSTDPILSEGNIRNCADMYEFNLVKDKIKQYLY
jgi:hypothetical protein